MRVPRVVIRGLTFRQPWLYAIKEMGKDRENRTWKPYRPPTHIALHGGVYDESKKYKRDLARAFVWMTENVPGATKQYLESRIYTWDDTVMTGIVGIMPYRGYDLPTAATSPWHLEGQWGWRIEDVVWLPEAIPCSGAQGLWTLPTAVETQLIKYAHESEFKSLTVAQPEFFGGIKL
jgi:hypothetical protein